MMLSYSDIVITIVIIAVVLYAAHRLGQVNPIGTGQLARRLSAVEAKVAAQGTQLTTMEDGLRTVAESSALVARGIEALRIEVAGDRGLTERTWSAVERLEGFFIEDSFKGRRGER